MITVCCISNRIGGLDVLFQSLEAQTYRDFELVLVDGLNRGSRAPDKSNWYRNLGLNPWPTFPWRAIPPRDNPFPKASFARSQNTGIVHARGETVLLVCDYSWLGKDCLATHAELQAKHHGPVTCDYDYCKLPPLKDGLPHYRETCAGDSPDYLAEVNANTARYAADVRSGKLDPFMWSIFREPLTEEAVMALEVTHRHRPSGADLANDWNYCSSKSESFPTELLLDLNGFDEEYDASHLYQDSELSYRLRARGIRWHSGPPETGMVTVVNPREILNIKHLEKPLSHNKEMCFGSRRAELGLAVNPGRSLREEWRANNGERHRSAPPRSSTCCYCDAPSTRDLVLEGEVFSVCAACPRPPARAKPTDPPRCHRCPSPGVVEVTMGPTFWLCPPCAQPIIAHVNSEPTMTDEAIASPIQVTSHGKVFRIMCSGEAWHPSWWSFLDELETREGWWTIKPGDVVADIGADFGSYSLSALAQGAATVYAWSPPFKVPGDSIECRTMRRSAALNGWTNRLIAFDTGLWSKPGYLAVRDDGRLTELCRTLDEAQARIVGGTSYCGAFGVSTLDSLGLSRLDWLKIDTEGGELPIMLGGEKTMRRCRPRILFENHVHIDPDCERKCREFLEAMGYRWVGTRQHHSVSHSLLVPE